MLQAKFTIAERTLNIKVPATTKDPREEHENTTTQKEILQTLDKPTLQKLRQTWNSPQAHIETAANKASHIPNNNNITRERRQIKVDTTTHKRPPSKLRYTTPKSQRSRTHWTPALLHPTTAKLRDRVQRIMHKRRPKLRQQIMQHRRQKRRPKLHHRRGHHRTYEQVSLPPLHAKNFTLPEEITRPRSKNKNNLHTYTPHDTTENKSNGCQPKNPKNCRRNYRSHQKTLEALRE